MGNEDGAFGSYERGRITLDLYRKCPGLRLPLLPGFFCQGTSDRDLA